MQSLWRKVEQQGAMRVESEVFLGRWRLHTTQTASPFPPLRCILWAGLHKDHGRYKTLKNCATVPVFSAVRFELVEELEESLVSVPTAEVVTLLALRLRTSDWNKLPNMSLFCFVFDMLASSMSWYNNCTSLWQRL